MNEPARNRSKDKVLYWCLLVYGICALAFPSGTGGIDSIRIPSFTLLLLVLVQVIFPRFRFSKSANLIAVLVIVGLGILSAKALILP